MNRRIIRLLLLLWLTAVFTIACQQPPPEIVEIEVRVTATPAPTAEAIAAPASDAPPTLRITPRRIHLTERRPQISLAFDEPMNHESVSRALRFSPAVPFSQQWQENTLHLQIEEALTPEQEYVLTVDQTAVSTSGQPLTQPYSQTYRLPPVIEGSHMPSRAGTNAPLTIRFNYAPDPDSLRQSLTIDPPLEGEISFGQNNRLLSFQPAAEVWPTGQRYTFHFSPPFVDENGDPLPVPEPMVFNTPPPILSRAPAGQSTHPAQPLVIEFDRPVDQTTTTAALTIEPETAGQITWQANKLIFQPDNGHFAPNSRYTITLAPTATDTAGNPLVIDPYQWTFGTADLTPIASFGRGPNVQVLAADGRRTLQYILFDSVTTATPAFALYELTPDQFLDRYQTGFSGYQEQAERPFSTEDTPLLTRWSETAVDSPHQWANLQEAQIPANVPAGLYILNLETGYLNDQLLLILSDQRLVVKQAEEQLSVWVTDQGQSAADVPLTIYDEAGQMVENGRTDQQGFYQTNLTADPLLVMAQLGDDIGLSGLSGSWRYGAGPYSWWSPPTETRQFAIYSYTDRPIYSPGQTVYFKAIVRQDEDAVLDILPAGSPVTARIRDARDNILQTFALTTNQFGTVHGQFQLAEGAGLGNYTLAILMGDDESHRQRFMVEEYLTPDYEVTLTTDADYYLDGDQIAVTVESSYYFGEPVANASVEINLFHLVGHGDYPTWYISEQRARSGRTDENGRFTFTIPANLSHYARSDWLSNLRTDRLAIEATIDDGSRQTVSGLAIATIYNAAEQVGLHTDSYAQQPEQPFTVRATVLDLDGQPVNGRALDLTLRRHSPTTHGYDNVIETIPLTMGTDGQASTSLTVENPGHYQLRLEGEDAAGNRLISSSYIYVFAPGRQPGWYSREDRQLAITADQAQYAPGDVAELMIESTFDGPALLTIERGTVRRELLVELTPPLTSVPLTIQADDVPNIYVTVNAWQEQDTSLSEHMATTVADARLLIASVELDVPASDKILNVTITADRESYAPRDEASFTLRVTNWDGVPVSAELSLAMVDEAIFALSEELAGPIYDGFYAPRPHQVRTYHSLAPVRDIFSGGMGGGGNGLAQNPRSDFPDTAAWWPVLQTDANGEVTVKLTLPDSLTSWRLTAKAATADTQIGEASHTITVQQDIVVRPILPRGLTAGDQTQLSALVHNYSSQPHTVTVALTTAENLLRLDTPISHTVSLAAGEMRVVGWGLTAQQAGEVELLTRVLSGTQTVDAVQLPLWIRPLAIPDVTTQIGTIDQEMATTITLPPNTITETSMIRVELSRSIAGTLLEGLDYLTGFPYGCVEQTMSRALPNAVVARAFNQLGVGNPAMTDQLLPQINAGLQLLYGYQHPNGGWGWWYDDETEVHQTAWVLFGLAVTADAGYEVDPAVIERGVNWLQERLDRIPATQRAYLLYVMELAGHGDPEAALAILPDHAAMDSFNQAALALTLHRLGAEAEAREVLETLAETAVADESVLIHWRGASGDGQYDLKSMASDTRSTALVLSAFTAIQPDSDLIPGTVAWLMGQRQQRGWGTTNETAYAVMALTDHLLATSFSEADEATSYTLLLNDESFLSGQLDREQPAVTLEIPASAMQPGDNSLRIEQSSVSYLYYVVNSRVYLAQPEIEAAGSIEIERSYRHPTLGHPITQTVAGQLVQVELVVTVRGRQNFMLVEDSLPGGLEALNENLNTTSHIGSAYNEPERFWQSLGYNHKEVRSDRVTFFITEMSSGRHTLSYMARATYTGQFVALPAEAYPMYDLTTWGRSASSALTVVE